MKSIRWRNIRILSSVVLVLAALVWIGLQLETWKKLGSIRGGTARAALVLTDPARAPALKAELPAEDRFRPVAESASLRLLADPVTAHFQVVSKSSGQVWRSYPDPQAWAGEKIAGAWRNNLLSPIIVEYVNLANYKSTSKVAGLIDEAGFLEQYQTTADGFTVTFVLPKGQFKIPIRVTLKDDYVETTILDGGIVEGALSLLNAKLYPLFGSQASAGQDGYLFVPDGPGALIRFKTDRIMPLLTYNHSIYGQDPAFFREDTGRQRIALPVFGLKSGAQAFLAVVGPGEAFANVFAAPSGSIGQSNWITAEWQYRKRFFQSVSKSTDQGFFTYSGERFTAPERTIRYYLLGSNAGDYAGMAAAYRSHLQREGELKRLEGTKPDIPLYIDLIGGDIEKGLVIDSYISATPASDAITLLQDVHNTGVRQVKVQFAGWQQDGYSTHGGYFPVESKLGGNAGMKRFIDLAHGLGVPVYLSANYTLNTNGDDGFWSRRDGLRDLAGNVLQAQTGWREDPGTMVSPKFYKKVIQSDLPEYKKLGADGIYYEDGIGALLPTDFNSKYLSSRADVIAVQRDLIRETADALGGVAAGNANAYAWKGLSHLHRLTDDYSYDIFVDEAIPFAQIVLHGSLTYTSEWSNMRSESRADFLRSIEYGAYPAYVFSASSSDKLRRAYTVWQYSLNYKDWLPSIKQEYERANEALGAVQAKWIVGHRTLAPGVKQTEYEGGYKIIVNYNRTEYAAGSLRVPAQDFAVVKGGASP
ncbi:DUF5696 domain-containing protein [Paenibacillus koleovorans]|uniref:DUF5696 domain-containing protein n=1 Tax=Paenibacillus koleovorans TaxID=121608 RepID=UPI000FD6FC20|nr:DUF5696 domain-containing protein [Paenibacillus koleovorans]